MSLVCGKNLPGRRMTEYQDELFQRMDAAIGNKRRTTVCRKLGGNMNTAVIDALWYQFATEWLQLMW